MKKRYSILFFIIALIFTLISIAYGEVIDSYSKGRIYYLKTTHDFREVSPSYSIYIKKNFDIVAKDPLAKAIIVEVDTPGGRVDSAEKIIKYFQNSTVKTITFVNNSAFSAGALISLAADYTVMTESGKIGDAYPIMIGAEGKPSSIEDKGVRAKLLSGLRSSIRSLAEKRRERLITEIGEGKYPHLLGSNSVRNMDKIFESMIDPDIVLTLEEDGHELNKGQILTLTTKEAYKLGVIDGVHNSLDDVLKAFDLKKYELVKLEATTGDQLFYLITHPVTTSILLTLGMLGMMMEFWTAGWGVPGTIGILALSIFFYGQIVGNDHTSASLVLFIIGVILLGVELFVIPGFGIVGVGGVLAIFISIIMALGFNPADIENTADNLVSASVILLISITLTIVLSIILSKKIKKTTSFSKFTLANSKIVDISHKENFSNLVGAEGIALTVLRPSGIVLVNDKNFDAVTYGDFIEKNSKVKITEVRESKIFVKKLEA